MDGRKEIKAMAGFKVEDANGKSYSVYTEENGRFFVQHVNWSEKYGIYIPQGKKRVSKAAYMVMRDAYCKGQKGGQGNG